MPCKTFKKLENNMTKKYFGEKVPEQYKVKYGKIYNHKDVEKFSHAVAKKRGLKV
jgi:hypothetical protein